jgi:glycerate dehydrogenase
MKIVVLDGYTLNPGDLSWEDFKKLGQLVLYDRTPQDLIIERAIDAEIVITNKTPLTGTAIAALPKLKYIGVLATGYNIIDVLAARERHISVTNIPTYGTSSVAQMAFALILELCHHVASHSDSVMSGKWSSSKDFCYWDHPLTELCGKTLGIVGLGRIGQQTANIGQAFGMTIVAYDSIHNDQTILADLKWADNLSELLSVSDVVSLHCPLLPETKGIINKESLRKMKNSAFLINTSRGPLVIDSDLADALNNNIIAGAGLDVLSTEPPAKDNPLFKAKNCMITPHIAWATKEARTRLMSSAADNLRSYMAGKPKNVVNG